MRAEAEGNDEGAMHVLVNPATVLSSENYSQGIEVRQPARWLSIAGQVGRGADGQIPDGIEAQAEIAWRNLVEVLKESGMDVGDLVEITVYLLNREDNAGFDAVRKKWLGSLRPASTKVYISGLAHPKMLCEIQARAAKAL
jgi:2-iminobutanoate/2-iminopropanoate deaminase